jgi:D-3-phosphoglycerate dehydrogenase
VADITIAVALGALATLDQLRERYTDTVEFRTADISTPAALAELTEGADALVVTLHRLDASMIEALPSSVRVIGRAGVGLDTIDLIAAAGRGIRVVFQPDYATNEVADHALAMLLATQRRIVAADQRMRAEGWLGGHDLGPVLALQESTAGVVGTGRIGRAVIDRLRPMVADILGFDADGASPAAGVRACADLLELLSGAQIVTLHLPLTEQTRHVIGAREIAAMPPGAILVNVSRGGLVDEVALADALHAGHLSAAALDVFETEPLPLDSPLRSAPNLVLSPHIAWYSTQSGIRLADWIVADVVEIVCDRAPQYGRIAALTSAPAAGLR